jgi:hypothetical protein
MANLAWPSPFWLFVAASEVVVTTLKGYRRGEPEHSTAGTASHRPDRDAG